MVSIHTTQPFLAFKLTTQQLVSRGTTIQAGITIKLNRYHACGYSIYVVNLGTIANLRPISTKAKTMDTYEAITYSLYTNTKDLSYKNGIYSRLMNVYKSTTKT